MLIMSYCSHFAAIRNPSSSGDGRKGSKKKNNNRQVVRHIISTSILSHTSSTIAQNV